ncbi:hypothetical protein ACHAW5_010920 [Stephanodiscus triporus]|uniref:Uncharacterized protein n=1 Tax=Stephanodiscus triporus TaxID=2934178 RepID=A0ABD3PBB7_9STRA
MDEIACWHLQLRVTQPTEGTVPAKLFEVFFVIIFVIHFIITIIIFVNILTKLIPKIGFGASIGCREREENAQDFLIEVVLDVE